MQLIYENMLGGDGGNETLRHLLGFSPSGDDLAYIQATVKGVCDHQAEIDEKIRPHLVKWTLERLARVDLAILRLAVYEIFYSKQVPDAVAANEAVELSRVYSTEEAGGFINGVLGSLIRAEKR